MDIERYVRKCLKKGISESKIIEDGFKKVIEVKDTDEGWARRFVEAVVEEVKTTEKIP